MGNELQERFNRLRTKTQLEGDMDIEEKIKMKKDQASKDFQARQDSEAMLLRQISGRDRASSGIILPEVLEATSAGSSSETFAETATAESKTEKDGAGGKEKKQQAEAAAAPLPPPTPAAASGDDGGEGASVVDSLQADPEKGGEQEEEDKKKKGEASDDVESCITTTGGAGSPRTSAVERVVSDEKFPRIEGSNKKATCCFCF